MCKDLFEINYDFSNFINPFKSQNFARQAENSKTVTLSFFKDGHGERL